MAKAGGKSITWILLSEAKERANTAYQSPEFAKRQLEKWLLTGELPWRSDILEGSKRDGDPGSGDPEFWREPVPPPQAPGDFVIILDPGPFLIITWDESRARRRWDYTHSYTFYRIEVAAEYLEKLQPAVGVNKDKLSNKGAKNWIVAEAKRMKAAGEIPSDITKTEFAKLLEGRLKAAARHGTVAKPVDHRHIVNNLEHAWGLWPISSI